MKFLVSKGERAVKAFGYAMMLTLASAQQAFAWGQEGHSIIAEIAEQQLAASQPKVMEKIHSILGPGVSMASIASWADARRDEAPQTENWHFVDMPVEVSAYDPAAHCARTPKGDCIVAQLSRLRNDVRCKKDTKQDKEQREALMFAVHFVGDIHQPLHTVLENQGGNTIDVLVFIHGDRCKHDCRISPMSTNLHAAWDSTLIQMTTWDWGSYVTRLKNGWLQSSEAQGEGNSENNFVKWAEETHRVAQEAWRMTPSNHILDEQYYGQALPVIDRQLGRAALRLSRFLTEEFSSDRCPVP
jgi:hypothetical protein